MPISGTFAAMTGTAQPMAAKPAPADRHGQRQQPDNAWSAPADATGGGYPDAQAEQVQMTGRGIRLDVGHERGHTGTAATRNARRPWIGQLAAQEASAAAHGDPMAGYFSGHQYDPQAQQFAGSRYDVVASNVRAIPAFSARTVIHGRPGGQHMDGQGGEFAPTGFPTGEAGRFAIARYSSPTLGAMYSRNTLRGVLPQTVATPYNQPGLTGAAGTKGSGIPSNARFLAKPGERGHHRRRHRQRRRRLLRPQRRRRGQR
jgi:hypothetical protein